MALQLSHRLFGDAFKDHDEARRLRVLDLEVFFFGTAIAQTSIDRPIIIAGNQPNSHRWATVISATGPVLKGQPIVGRLRARGAPPDHGAVHPPRGGSGRGLDRRSLGHRAATEAATPGRCRE